MLTSVARRHRYADLKDNTIKERIKLAESTSQLSKINFNTGKIKTERK